MLTQLFIFLFPFLFFFGHFLIFIFLAELLWWETFAPGKDAVDRVQPGAGVRHRIHHRLPGGEAGREPQQQPDTTGESRVSRHHQNGGGALLLVGDLHIYLQQSTSNWFVECVQPNPRCVFAVQDHSLLSVGGQPGGNPEDAVSERTAERRAQVDPESPDRRHRQEGDVRARHRALFTGGGLWADGEGHAHPGHSIRWWKLIFHFIKSKTGLSQWRLPVCSVTTSEVI